VGDRLVDQDPVVPDLAYGFPVELYFRREALPADRPVVGLSPIAHCDPRVGPVRDESRYRSYLERLATVAAGLLESDHDLVLYGTDGSDIPAADDLRREIARRVRPELLSRVTTPKVTTVRELFEALARVDIVLASRLHGVLLPHLASIPVAALSYERKVATLMAAMDCKKYCDDIDTFRASTVLDGLRDLLAQRAPLSKQIEGLVNANRRQVDAQYDLVFPRSS
jgi:polysaccharide pyruvyl transferase WcaK-like protein